MAQNLDNTNEQFNEKEPRNASFKALFNVLQTTSFKQISAEAFSKGFPTFPDEIIYEADTIKFSNDGGDEFITPSRIRTWITASATSLGIDETAYNNLEPIEKLIRGHFSASIPNDVTSNPYVEKIICPLSKLEGSNDQFYFVFAAESQSSDNYENSYYESDPGGGYNTKEIDGGYVFENQQYILKNFISPYKSGLGYQIKIFGSINPDNVDFQIRNPHLFL